MRTVRLAIDLNVRLGHDETFCGFEDADGMVNVGDVVTVHAVETHLEGPARVIALDFENRLIYVRIDWRQLAEPGEPGNEET